MFFKRCIDIVASALGLLILSPVLLFFMTAIFLQDLKSPLFLGMRVGKDGKLFKMYKLRSMVVNAGELGGVSTAGDDMRITPVGVIVRKAKLDELMQLVNVLNGSMSLVGPRPNVSEDTARYTEVENAILEVKPGITDFASIVFADEGVVLSGSDNPDLRYNQVIRPWKSRLALFYIENRSTFVDVALIIITVIGVISRGTALKLTSRLLHSLGGAPELVEVAMRRNQLVPSVPPGANQIVTRL